MTTSNTTHLAYFDKLLNSNIEGLKYEAISEKERGFGSAVESFVELIDYEKGIIKYWQLFYDERTDGPVDALVTYNFAQKFPKEVFAEAEQLKNYIDSTVLEINKNGNNANHFLISQVKYLNILVDKFKVIYPKHIFIEEAIQNIINHLVYRHSLKESYKKPKSIINTKISFFDIKPEVKMVLLAQLYNVSVDLEIIDDEIISEDTFVNVLSDNPTVSNEVIIFKCNNELIAQFINCIQPLFNNLSTAQINKSKSFLNKKRKVLNQADLDNANKRLRRKTSPQIEKITNHISRILKS